MGADTPLPRLTNTSSRKAKRKRGLWEDEPMASIGLAWDSTTEPFD